MSYKEYIEGSQKSASTALVVFTTLNILGAVLFLIWMQVDKSEALMTWRFFGWLLPWVTIPINLFLGLVYFLGLDGPNEVDKLIIRGEEIRRQQKMRD